MQIIRCVLPLKHYMWFHPFTLPDRFFCVPRNSPLLPPWTRWDRMTNPKLMRMSLSQHDLVRKEKKQGTEEKQRTSKSSVFCILTVKNHSRQSTLPHSTLHLLLGTTSLCYQLSMDLLHSFFLMLVLSLGSTQVLQTSQPGRPRKKSDSPHFPVQPGCLPHLKI